jgi:CRP-like cAMP-binding protein
MASQTELVDELASLSLFADLARPQLEAVAHTFEEVAFPSEQRVLRQGFEGGGFYVILEGEVAIRVDGEERARLGRGDFFGEAAILLGERPNADVVALRSLRCAHLAGHDLQSFLVAHPHVMYRMLLEQTRRVRNANLWRR